MIKQARNLFFPLFACLRFFGSVCVAFNTASLRRSPSGSILGRPVSPVLIYSTPPEARHSFVEGSTFDDYCAEIEAMGGDPFFMDDGEEREAKMAEIESSMVPKELQLGTVIEKTDKESFPNGKGPTRIQDDIDSDKPDPDWEWDGIVDEDAHLD